MLPFVVSQAASQLRPGFIQPRSLLDAANSISQSELTGLTRHWLIEGTPFAFVDAPMLFEVIRTWLASRLAVNALEIKLVGSARTGFSLAGSTDFGKPFGSHSDLDLLVVSSTLFSKCRDAFHRWSSDFKAGKVVPANSRESAYWSENLRVVSDTLIRGFVDPNKIPNRDPYPIAQEISQAMWLLKAKLDISQSGPSIRKATVRIYDSWHHFHKQVAISFKHAATNAANGS
jgi:hypothetical protein